MHETVSTGYIIHRSVFCIINHTINSIAVSTNKNMLNLTSLAVIAEHRQNTIVSHINKASMFQPHLCKGKKIEFPID